MSKHIIQNTYFKSNLLTKIVYDYNAFDSLDIDRFRYSAIYRVWWFVEIPFAREGFFILNSLYFDAILIVRICE